MYNPFIDLTRNGRLVIVTMALRSLDYSFFAVFLGIHLNMLALSELQVGIVISSVMLGSALSNLMIVLNNGRLSLRVVLIVLSIFMILGGLLYSQASSMHAFLLAGLIGFTSSSGGDNSGFQSAEIVILAETVESSKYTSVMSLYNYVGYIGKLVGAATVSAPSVIATWFGVTEVESARYAFLIYSFVALGILLFYSLLSNLEKTTTERFVFRNGTYNNSKDRLIYKLAGLFSVDSFGGGLITHSFIAYWLSSRFGFGYGGLSILFFVIVGLNGLSIISAVPLSRKFGLVNTIAYSQIAANICVVLMVLSDQIYLVLACLLLRGLLNEIDVPPRQALILNLVHPDRRSRATALTSLGRNLGQIVSPLLSGPTASFISTGTPMLVGAMVKFCYNGGLLMMFRGLSRNFGRL